MNLCIFTGYFSQDPQPRQVNGTTVLNFKLIVTRKFKKSNGELNKQVSALDFEVWDSGAETIVKYFKRGDYITVQCSARSYMYEVNDTLKIPKVLFRVNEFEFVKCKNDQQHPQKNSDEQKDTLSNQ